MATADTLDIIDDVLQEILIAPEKIKRLSKKLKKEINKLSGIAQLNLTEIKRLIYDLADRFTPEDDYCQEELSEIIDKIDSLLDAAR